MELSNLKTEMRPECIFLPFGTGLGIQHAFCIERKKKVERKKKKERKLEPGGIVDF